MRTERTAVRWAVGTGTAAALAVGVVGPLAGAADAQPLAKKSGMFTGATSTSNQYTPTTVVIKVVKGSVKSVTVKVSPTDPASVTINADAVPQLVQQALVAQSAKKVTGVSGASLTTNAFKQSLQSALTKAGIKG